MDINRTKNTDITFHYLNAAYMQIECEASILYELYDDFSFYIPNYQYHPLVKRRVWDGMIRLINRKNHQVFAGLKEQIVDWATEHKYTTNYEPPINALNPIGINEWIEKQNSPFKIKDYQFDTFFKALHGGRFAIESPTGSGKSFIIYLLTKFYETKTLIIVPTIGLVTQMQKDFADYGESDIHCIFAGEEKNTDKLITVSTWQSIYKEPISYFDQYRMVVGDECHGFTAKSLTDIMSKCHKANIRFGFTGTLNDTQVHRLTLEGLFGPVIKLVTTSQLVDEGHLAKPIIKIITLNHPDAAKAKLDAEKRAVASRTAPGKKYKAEMDFICQSEPRNRFIKNLALSLKGNTLVLFRFVEKHGVPLFDMINAEVEGLCHYVAGGTDKEDRENIRNIIIQAENSINICSYGVFSTGINIPNLNNIIFASPYKSKIKVLQSIGRGLRLSEGKNDCIVYDITDDLTYKGNLNYTLLHSLERLRFYNQENFEYKTYRIDIGHKNSVQKTKTLYQ